MGRTLVWLIAALTVSGAANAATLDTTTQGNWIGTYGHDGYVLFAYNGGGNGTYIPTASKSNDIASLPSYVSDYTYSSGFQQYVWATGTTDARAPQNPADPTGTRNAATSFINNDGKHQTITLTLTAPTQFQLGVYGLDWDNYNNRDATVTVNGESIRFDNTDMSSPNAYNHGEWGIFNVNAPAGSLVIDFVGNATAGTNSNSVLSALTFDPAPEPAALSLLALAGVAALARRRRLA